MMFFIATRHSLNPIKIKVFENMTHEQHANKLKYQILINPGLNIGVINFGRSHYSLCIILMLFTFSDKL